MNSPDEEIVDKPLDNTSLSLPNTSLSLPNTSLPLPNNSLTLSNTFYSSLVFLTNVAHNLFYENYFYAAAFMFLTITSLFYHSHMTSKLIYVIDKIAIIIVVLHGSYFFYIKCFDIQKPIEYFYATTIVIMFLSTLFLYYYGFQCQKYCFSLDIDVAQFYHVLIHIISSVGHHLITNFWSTFHNCV